jgi:hypothetical protein
MEEAWRDSYDALRSTVHSRECRSKQESIRATKHKVLSRWSSGSDGDNGAMIDKSCFQSFGCGGRVWRTQAI